jgi:carotenoid cleavage dioxygenase-like enzyme
LLSGRVPEDLSGAFYRIGPAQFERAGERLGHWFDGDGMIQRFAFAGGRVRHRGRFVNTPKRRAESAAKHFLYPGYGFGPRSAVPFTRPDDLNAANTNVLPMGDEIWALWEGGSPWRVEAGSLETIGRRQFADAVDGTAFSAHPKRGPDGDVWNFGGFGSRCVIWRLDRNGALLSAAPIALPGSTLMHDFAVTRSCIVLIAPPMIETTRPVSSLIDRFDWTPSEPLAIIVLDKADLSRQRVYELPARFLFHIGNAWEDAGGTIRIDALLYADARFATRASRDLALGRLAESPNARPTLLTLHANGRAEMSALAGAGEFPRVNPRRIGERHRYTYGVIESGLARWDWEGGRSETFIHGRHFWAEEPVFVPRQSRSGETDGWVLATRLNLRTEKTELCVFDARSLDGGPIAVLACPYALPLGFHGAFAQ